jgi:hypothetical protein
MTDQQLLTIWFAGLGVFALVILIAAALLITILMLARSIERGASAGLGLVKQIRENTNVIWKLQDTNGVAQQLVGGANAILKDAGQIAQALHEADVRQGRAKQ